MAEGSIDVADGNQPATLVDYNPWRADAALLFDRVLAG